MRCFITAFWQTHRAHKRAWGCAHGDARRHRRTWCFVRFIAGIWLFPFIRVISLPRDVVDLLAAYLSRRSLMYHTRYDVLYAHILCTTARGFCFFIFLISFWSVSRFSRQHSISCCWLLSVITWGACQEIKYFREAGSLCPHVPGGQ